MPGTENLRLIRLDPPARAHAEDLIAGARRAREARRWAWLLWDNADVVSAHTTRAGAEAAQAAYVATDPLLEGWSEGRNPMGVMITRVPLKA